MENVQDPEPLPMLSKNSRNGSMDASARRATEPLLSHNSNPEPAVYSRFQSVIDQGEHGLKKGFDGAPGV